MFGNSGVFLTHVGCNLALEGDLGAAGLSFRAMTQKGFNFFTQMTSKRRPRATFGAAWRSFRPTFVSSGATLGSLDWLFEEFM